MNAHSVGHTNAHQIVPAQHLRLPYFALWLIIPFCSFTSHTIFPLPPTLLLLVAAIVLLVTYSTRIFYSRVLILPVVTIGYYMITQPFTDSPVGRYMGVIFSLLYFLVVVAYGNKLPAADREKLVRKFIPYSVALLTVEGIWRLSHPDLSYAEFEGVDVRWIYQYKFGGLMYRDSNAVGIHLVILFFFILYQEQKTGEKWKISKFVILVLLVFTFSRAAWAGTALGWIYFRFLREKRVDFYIANGLIATIALFLIYNFFIAETVNSDFSFLSKLDIVNVVVEYVSSAPFLPFMVGIGFSNSLEVLGVYAHNFFVVVLIESGLIGLILVLLQFFVFIKVTKKKALIILVPFVLTTLSSTIMFLPFFYVIMALMYLDIVNPARNEN